VEKMEQYKKICQGKTAALFVGGSRGITSHLLKDLGMDIVLAGYEFAHRTIMRAGKSYPQLKKTVTAKT
jgi:nitrogenase molybdenum-iron protein alpha chain